MTSIKISWETGCWVLHDFSAPNDHYCFGSWDKSKNPYPLTTCIIPDSASAKASGTIGLQASRSLYPKSWELCNFSRDITSCNHDFLNLHGLPLSSMVAECGEIQMGMLVLHAKPSQVPQEIDALDDVYDRFVTATGEQVCRLCLRVWLSGGWSTV